MNWVGVIFACLIAIAALAAMTVLVVIGLGYFLSLPFAVF